MEYNFKIPLVPESINSLYRINYNHRVIYLSEEGRAFKYHAKLFIPKMSFQENSRITMSASYFTDWYYKNGNIRRADSSNLDKLVIDTVFESIGIDDSRLWEWYSKKVQYTGDKHTLIEVKEFTDSGESTHAP